MAKTPPLNPQLPMVDPDTGRPTPFFMRWWQEQIDTNGTIVPLTNAAEVSAVLDLLDATPVWGDILYRGEELWENLGAGSTGQLLSTAGPGAAPAWVTASFLYLDDTPSAYTSQSLKFVRVNSGETALEFFTAGLDDLSDVDFTASANVPADGDVLTYEVVSGVGTWVPRAAGGGGASSLNDLSDVDLTTAATDGDGLIYIGADSTFQAREVVWINNSISYETLAYSNDGGQGDRTSNITVTYNLTPGGGNPNNHVDGSQANGTSTSWYFASGNTTGIITYTFADGVKQIDQATWYQDTATTHGTWRWEGSDDGVSWDVLSSNFTLGGTAQVQNFDLWDGTSAYDRFRLVQQSGSTSINPWLREIEFRIGNQLVSSGANLSIDELEDVDTTTTTPSDGDVLTYEVVSGVGTWVPAASGGGSATLVNTQTIAVATSDETTDLTTGTAKITFRIPYDFIVDEVRASVTTAPTGAALTVDINQNGTSILSTKLTIDATEKTSTTAATPAVISTSELNDDDEITVDIDQIGSTIAGAGLKVYLIGRRAAPEAISIAVSDETTDLTTGTAKTTFRMPYGFTLTDVRASVTTAPTGATLTVDINEGGTSVLSTKLTIDAGEKTSTTAATPAVISDSALADDAEITIDIDQIGSTIAGAGLKVYLIGTQT